MESSQGEEEKENEEEEEEEYIGIGPAHQSGAKIDVCAQCCQIEGLTSSIQGLWNGIHPPWQHCASEAFLDLMRYGTNGEADFSLMMKYGPAYRFCARDCNLFLCCILCLS